MQMMRDSMEDVRAACQTALDYCVECLHQCEACANSADDVHQTCIATCKQCVEACSICVHDCTDMEVTADQMKASMQTCMDICAVCVKDCQACAEACSICMQACTVCGDACQLCGTVCSQEMGTDQGGMQANQNNVTILQARFSAAKVPALRSETWPADKDREAQRLRDTNFSSKEKNMPNLKPYYDAALAADAEVKRILAEMDAAFNDGTPEGKQKALDLRPALDEAQKKAKQANELYASMRDASLVNDNMAALFTTPPDVTDPPGSQNLTDGKKAEAPKMKLTSYRMLPPKERLAFAKKNGQLEE
jgi:hypothetical protein